MQFENLSLISNIIIYILIIYVITFKYFELNLNIELTKQTYRSHAWYQATCDRASSPTSYPDCTIPCCPGDATGCATWEGALGCSAGRMRRSGRGALLMKHNKNVIVFDYVSISYFTNFILLYSVCNIFCAMMGKLSWNKIESVCNKHKFIGHII